MQQWARSSQSRSPPAVIMPWLKHQQQKQQQLLTNSSFAPHNEEQDDKDSSSSYLSRSNNTSVSSLATSFQSMMMTRHTGTSFSRKAVAMQESQSNQEDQRALLASAIDRAVACGQMAPNHRRTEPFTFKRLIAPSDLTRRLSDIAYHVNLLHSPNSSTQVAEKKRQKWLDVAAFLVALCHDNQHPPPLSSSASSSTTNQDITHGNLEDESQNAKLQSSSSLIYKPLPYCAPESERQLEDVSNLILHTFHSLDHVLSQLVHYCVFNLLFLAHFHCDMILSVLMQHFS